MTVIISGTEGVSDVDGSAGTPAIRGTDANTGIFFPAADTIAFAEGGVESMRIDSSGRVGVATSTPDSSFTMTIQGIGEDNTSQLYLKRQGNNQGLFLLNGAGAATYRAYNGLSSAHVAHIWESQNNSTTVERARITSDGNFLVGKTNTGFEIAGARIVSDGRGQFTASGLEPLALNRLTNDGNLIEFYQANTLEGTISVSGTTVSYNGGNLSRWAQMLTKPELLKGTVMSNLDEMNEYVDADGNPVENEQLNKVKVSDVEGDANVAGVFVNWTYDEAHQVDEINMAMTGDMIIRIGEGVTVARGDLLMSAGDGTAKPQGDDIVRSKTIAKVTSTHVTCTYDDGSYCVPCVLMAC